jgi:hypothetical protein
VAGLVILGLALIALSIIAWDHEVMAAIFAFTGVATAIFGVLLPRLEGNFELSPTRLVANLKAIGAREDLSFEDLANEFLKLLGISGSSLPTGRWASADPVDDIPSSSQQAQERRSDAASKTVPLPVPVEFIVAGDISSPGAVAMAFERHVEDLFQRTGWKVESQSRSPDRGIDFTAERDSEKVLVTVILRRRVSVADVRNLIGLFSSLYSIAEGAQVVAVNQGALTIDARHTLAEFSEIQILEIPVVGW